MPRNEPRRESLKPGWLGSLEPLPWSWVVDQLERARNYWLVTARVDGFPQARPVWGLWHDDLLYLSIGGGGLGRTDDGDSQPATVHLESAANVVIVEGGLRRLSRAGSEGHVLGDDELDRMIDAWNRKYGSNWSREKHGFNRVLTPDLVLAWREREDRTDADASGKWVFD